MAFEKLVFLLDFLILLLSVSSCYLFLYSTDIINAIFFLKKNQCSVLLLNSKIPKQVIKRKDYLLRIICQLQ